MPTVTAKKQTVSKPLMQVSKLSRHEPAYNYIGGKWVPAKSGKTFDNYNPATGELLGRWPMSSTEDLNRAVEAAKKAYESWRKTPAPKRADYLLKAHNILVERKDELSRVMTQEMGKVLKETAGDAQEAIDTALYFAGEGRRLFGQTIPSELADKFAMTLRMPVGVCGLITPWNFPLAIPSWKLIPAILCGNTVVLKPSDLTPATATLFVEILEEAGLPAGVVNLVHDSSASEVGKALVEHPDVRLISFTGSSRTGSEIASTCGKLWKKVSLEMGGKNAQIIMEDADLDLALEGSLWGAFGTTGQRCTATSRLIIHKDVYKTYLDRLASRASKIKMGNGLNADTQMGPIVAERQIKNVEKYMEVAVKEDRAKVLIGGKRATGGELAKGWFFEPTILEGTADMRVAQEEIFGPVVTAIKVSSYEEAISVLNNTVYGLSGSLYTQNIRRMMQAIRDMETGITYINAPTIGAEAHLPFGGIKRTGNGHREASQAVLDIFTEWKSVYVDYSGRLQKAQIDN